MPWTIFWRNYKMNKNELKKVLKPLIKECIKEVLLEKEGVLSNVISEVVRGVQVPILESKESISTDHDEKKIEEARRKYEEERQRKIKRLNEVTGGKFFEGTKPIKKEANSGSQYGPMGSQSPSDPGVDITGILALAGGKWKQHTKG